MIGSIVLMNRLDCKIFYCGYNVNDKVICSFWRPLFVYVSLVQLMSCLL